MKEAAILPGVQARSRIGTGRLVGGVMLGMVVLATLAGPWLVAEDPARQDLLRSLQPPGGDHPFGTDHLGRSLAARLLAAARLSLGLALVSVLSAAISGTLLGILAGWRGGWLDRLCTFLADAVLALPGLLLVLLLAALAPGAMWPLYLGISLVLWVEYYRVVRATVRPLATSPQVEASMLLGFGWFYILKRHLLPEVAPLVLTLGAFGAGSAILAIGSLGFIGVGLRPPTAEWGLMITELFPYYYEAPWAIAQPLVMIFVTVLALFLLAGRGTR